MSIKISELPQASAVNNTDVVPIVQNGTTKKATAESLKIINYSTTEQVVGKWIDGKPLYRRVMTGIVGSTRADGEYASVQADIADNIDFAYIALQIEIRTDNIVVNWPRFYINFQQGIQTISNCSINSQKKLNVGNSIQELNAGTYYVWVEYTKTTDTATRSLNLSKSANTGELVGIGDRVELTDETKQDEEQTEKQVEQVENISEEKQEEKQKENQSEAEPIETKTEGSGDIK